MKSAKKIKKLIKKRRYKASPEIYNKALSSFLQAVDATEIDSNRTNYKENKDIDCIWFDTQTKLPVRIEERGWSFTNEPNKTLTIIQDQFDYNPGLSADTFIPETPEGFIHAHPDEIRADRERQQKE